MSTMIVKRLVSYFWYYGASDSWKAIYSLLEKADGVVLLDLGCGDGSSTMLVAKHIGASEVFGIDIDDEKLKKAGERGIIAYKANLNSKFPLDNESVDVVFTNQVIEHLIDVDNFVKEIYRVLRTEGYAIVCTENLASWHNIFALILGDQPYSGPYVSTKFVIGRHPLHSCVDSEAGASNADVKHNTVLAYKALRQVFQAYGFSIEKIIGSGYYPFPKAFAKAFCRLDPAHSHFLNLKVRKPPRCGLKQDEGHYMASFLWAYMTGMQCTLVGVCKARKRIAAKIRPIMS